MTAKKKAPPVPNIKDFSKPEDYAQAYLQWTKDRAKAAAKKASAADPGRFAGKTKASAPPCSPELMQRRVGAAIRRMERSRKEYGKDVIMLDPTLAKALIESGHAVACQVRDFETADKKFLYEPPMHQAVRIKKVQV